MGDVSGRRTCSLGGLGAVPLVWSRAEGELAGQTGSDGRAGAGQGRRTPRLGVGCSRAYGKREFTGDSDVGMGMTENGGGRQGRKVRI